MTETTNTQPMLDAFKRTQADIASLLDAFKRTQADIASLADWFECELENFDDDNVLTWASVGTLAEVRRKLIKTLAYFSGVSQAEIQRSLDELHM